MADGHHEARIGQDTANMRGHVIGSLLVMLIARIAIGNMAGEMALHIPQDQGIGIFGDDQGGAGVLTEDLAQPGLHAGIPQNVRHLAGDGEGTATAGGDGETGLMKLHGADGLNNGEGQSCTTSASRIRGATA